MIFKNIYIGLGQYQLLGNHKAAIRSVDELDLLKCHSLHEIVEHIQDIKTRNTENCTFHEVHNRSKPNYQV